MPPRPARTATNDGAHTEGAGMPTPRLRFLRFKETGWHETPLCQLASIITERAGTEDCVPYTVTSGVGLLSQQDKFGRSIAGNSLKNYVRLREHDFAYNKSATKAFPEGYIARYSGTDRAAVPNSIFTCFRPSLEEINPVYLEYLFSSNLHGRWLRKFLTIGARAHGSLNVDDDDLMALPVPRPAGRTSLAEQRKIADCLTSLDKCIAAHGRKVEALKAHKKGLMQHLFPQEGQTTPRLRFPEFRNGPEWDVRPLGPLAARVGSGITPLGGERNYKHTGRPFVRSQNVGWGELLLDDVAYIDDETHSSFAATEVVEGDVLLNITGASIGRSAVADDRIAGGNVNQHVCVIRVDPKVLNAVLLNQFLLSDGGQEQVDSFQAGGNRQGLNFAQVRSFMVPLPPTTAEQQRIADCLASLDAAIAATSAALTALKAYKKGLMQGLFPPAI